MDKLDRARIEREKELLTFWIASPEIKLLEITVYHSEIPTDGKLHEKSTYEGSFPEFFSDQATYDFLGRFYPDWEEDDYIWLEGIAGHIDGWAWRWREYISLWNPLEIAKLFVYILGDNQAYFEYIINPEKELLKIERERWMTHTACI